MKHRKIILIILDGWGLGKKTDINPVWKARTPKLDYLFSHYPHSKLKASGLAVGLPNKVMGNSEVGHLNLGAGRVIIQDLVKINKACENSELENNKYFKQALKKARAKNRKLHFIGLVSDAGVHSHVKHLNKMCELARKEGVNNIFIHAISDGRDTDPKSGYKYIKDLEKNIEKSKAQIASVIGRYFAMDRDNHWERVKKAYDLFVFGKGEKSQNIKESIKKSYEKGITDEFIKPIVRINESGDPIGLIKNDDVVICFNFRTERLREITIALSQKNFLKYKMKKLSLNYFTLTKYDDFEGVQEIFSKDNILNTLGEVISKNNLKQLRLAETEKFAHVTYFFSGGRNKLFKGEERILINSPRIATYDLKPEMSALKITKSAQKAIKSRKFNFICINFANCDMVGHTGVFNSILKAVETVDTCVGEIYDFAKENDYEIIVTADHGNAEVAVNKDGSQNTAHSLNSVPCLLVSDRFKRIKSGKLADIAPTILKMADIKKPKEMTGSSLV